MQDKVIRNPNLQTFYKQGIGTLHVIYVNNVAYVRRTDIVKCICPNSEGIIEFNNKNFGVINYVKISSTLMSSATIRKSNYFMDIADVITCLNNALTNSRIKYREQRILVRDWLKEILQIPPPEEPKPKQEIELIKSQPAELQPTQPTPTQQANITKSKVQILTVDDLYDISDRVDAVMSIFDVDKPAAVKVILDLKEAEIGRNLDPLRRLIN